MVVHELEFERLSKRLSGKDEDAGSRLLFHEASGKVGSGETVVLLGMSGQGKSTLLRMLALLEQPDSGTIALDGGASSAMEPKTWRRQVCYTAQLPVMLPGSVEFNLAAASRLHGAPFDRELANRLMGDLGLAELDPAKDASELSGGEKQRVSLIRSLLLRPHFLLLDEITASLDAGSAMRVEKLLAQWASEEGAGIIWITHDREQARRVSRRIWFMARNTILESGETARFFARPQTREAADYLSGAEGADSAGRAEGDETVGRAEGKGSISGAEGSDSQDGANGAEGADFMDGAEGTEGKDSVDWAEGADSMDGAEVTEGKDSMSGVEISDSQDGANGADFRDRAEGTEGKDSVDGVEGTGPSRKRGNS